MELLNHDQALKYARAGADEFKDSPLRVAFNRAVPKDPRLVQRIDRNDSFYFIVSFTIGDRETSRVILDAFDGTLEEAAGIEKEGESLTPYLTEREAMSTLFVESSAKKKWETTLRQGTIGLHPVLVWKPCRQSSSPFMPFYQFSTGRSFVYLRVDRQLSEALTNSPV